MDGEWNVKRLFLFSLAFIYILFPHVDAMRNGPFAKRKRSEWIRERFWRRFSRRVSLRSDGGRQAEYDTRGDNKDGRAFHAPETNIGQRAF